jgi:hypothetical protein
MSRSFRAAVALVLLSAAPLAAQGTVVRPEPALDAGRASLRDALLRFRDSLNSIDAAAGRLQRDYRQASTASLISRARVMQEACDRSLRNLPAARKAVVASDASEGQRLRRRREMLTAMEQLGKALTRCRSEFGAMSQPGEGEQVRGYGNDRATRVQAALRRYEVALATFFSAMGIKVAPLGAPVRPLAG